MKPAAAKLIKYYIVAISIFTGCVAGGPKPQSHIVKAGLTSDAGIQISTSSGPSSVSGDYLKFTKLESLEPEKNDLVFLALGPSDDKLKTGIESFKKNDYIGAIIALREYLVSDKAVFKPEAAFILAASLVSTGVCDEAEEVLTKYPPPEHLDDYRDYYLAEIKFRTGRYEEAAKLFHKLTLKTGSLIAKKAAYRVADSLFASEDYAEALDAYKTLLKSSGATNNLDVIYYNMAVCAYNEGDNASAAKYAMKVWYKYPTSMMSSKASEILKDIKDEDPSLGNPTYKQRYLRVLQLEKAFQAGQAVSELTVLYDEIPDAPENRAMLEKCFFKLGQLYVKKRDFKTAGDILKIIISGSDFSPKVRKNALFELANLEKKANEDKKAIGYFLEFARNYPQSKNADDAVYQAAWLYYDSGNYDEAIRLYHQLLVDYPSSDVRSDVLWFLAWTYYKKGELEKAQTLMEQLATEDPASDSAPRASYYAAKFALKAGRNDKAKAGFEKLLKYHPLNFYAFLAQNRLKETWNIKPTPLIESIKGMTVGGDDSDDDDSMVIADAFASADANSEVAIKAAALMRLGFNEDAGAELNQMKSWNHDDPESNYIASSMYFLAGDYYRSIVSLRPFFVANMLKNPSYGYLKFWKRMFPLAFRNFVEMSSKLNGIDPLLILSISREESTFRPQVVSPVGARGLMQIMPRTGLLIAKKIKDESYEDEDLAEPQKNLKLGGWYLRELITKFKGQLPLAISAYNAGPTAVTRWLKSNGNLELDEFIEEIPYKETRNYTKRVLQTYGIYRSLYLGIPDPLPLVSRIDAHPKDNIDF